MTNRLASGFGWSFLEACFRLGLQFALSVVLARLLTPAEFGLIGIVSIFNVIAMTCVDAGFGNALIQRKEVTETEKSSVFYLNVVVGLLTATVLALSAPLIAWFFHQPVLITIIRVMSLNIIIGSLGSTQISLMSRELRFKPSFLASTVAGLASSAIAVVMAALGYGVWSLVTQALTATVLSTGIIWWMSPWRPRERFRLDAIQSLIPFSSKLFASSVIDAAFDRAQSAVIGRVYSASDLGYYSRATNTQALPVGLLTAAVQKVGFPYFAKVANNPATLRSAVVSVLKALAFATSPILFLLASVAHPFVLSIFGPKWLPSVPYLQILCLSGLLWPFHVVNLHALLAQGRSDIFFRLEIAKKLITASIVLLTFRHGVEIMAWGVVASSVGCAIVNSYYSGVHLDYPIGRQLRDMLGQSLPAFPAALAVQLLRVTVSASPLQMLALCVLAFGVVWALAAALWPPTRATVLRVREFAWKTPVAASAQA